MTQTLIYLRRISAFDVLQAGLPVWRAVAALVYSAQQVTGALH